MSHHGCVDIGGYWVTCCGCQGGGDILCVGPLLYALRASQGYVTLRDTTGEAFALCYVSCGQRLSGLLR